MRETFLWFVEERHRIWAQRQLGISQPWTYDPILASRKFTNVFRVLDYGSQYVLTDLLDPFLAERDQLARLFLYRHTGRVEAWQYLEVALGGYPLVGDLDDVFEVWKEYRGPGVTKFKNVKPAAERPNKAGGFQYSAFQRPTFTGAYLVFPQSTIPGTDKLESIIDLTKRLFDPKSPQDIMPTFLRADNQPERFRALRDNKGVADFMSMQILTDWGYSEQCGEDRENDFVVPGPGAIRGANHIDPSAKPTDMVYRMTKAIRSTTGCPSIETPLGTRRAPSLMDVQNCLCEFSKYVRYMQKPVPEQAYRPAHPGPQPMPALPVGWTER